MDNEKGAVDIARLRFWLSIVVDEDTPSPLPNLDYKIMQGNSLIESYQGVDLSELTYKRELKKDRGEVMLFVDEKNRLQKTVYHLLATNYSCCDHEKKLRLRKQISEAINQQLEAQFVNSNILKDLKKIDLAGNNQFFLWHTWFSDVFNRADGKSGFDIVIGNPPYIDSETMTQLGQTELREYITKNYKYIKGNWDIYMAFLEWGLCISNGCLCYITPDKWLSKPFGSKFREFCMIPRMSKILHTGNKTFESAMVDAIITLFIDKAETISAYKFDEDRNIVHMNSVPSSSIPKPYYIDSLFSKNNYLVRKLEIDGVMLHSIAECENACATHDAYELSPYVHNLIEEFDSFKVSKLVNTGTIDKFSNKWGVKDITYLGSKYMNPVVDKRDFCEHFGKSNIRKALSKKLIFKGLNLLDGFIDLNGTYIPGKSTLVICSNNTDNLKFLCGLLNSKLAIFYIKSKYSSSSYCGGITFSKDMINNFPIPSCISNKDKIISVVDEILEVGYSDGMNKKLNEIVYSIYNLSLEEIKVIEQNT